MNESSYSSLLPYETFNFWNLTVPFTLSYWHAHISLLALAHSRANTNLRTSACNHTHIYIWTLTVSYLRTHGVTCMHAHSLMHSCTRTHWHERTLKHSRLCMGCVAHSRLCVGCVASTQHLLRTRHTDSWTLLQTHSWMHSCNHATVHAYSCTRTHAWVCTELFACAPKLKQLWAQVYTYTYIYSHKHAPTFVHMQPRTHSYTRVRSRTLTRGHKTYVHIHWHICACMKIVNVCGVPWERFIGKFYHRILVDN